MVRLDNTLIVKDAQIRFDNLEGREDKYNPPGRRHFTVVVPEDEALELKEKNWRLRHMMDEWLLPVYFAEGAYPGLDLGDISGKTLVVYGNETKVKTTKNFIVSVKAFLAGINEPKEHEDVQT